MTLFGLHTALEGCSVDELLAVWRHAEDVGFDWISVWDHLLPAVRAVDAGSLDSAVCQTALAMSTRRVRVGSLVYSTGFRHPAILARTAATIDHLSAGRMELGLGAGWNRDEYDAFGFKFEAPAVRLRRLEEAATVVRLLWQGESANFDGEFYQLVAARCGVRPMQKSPRIWIGASGEKLGLKVAAAVNDGWNCNSVTPSEFARKRGIVLDAAHDPDRIVCAVNVGYDPDTGIGNGHPSKEHAIGTLTGSIEQITNDVGQYVAAGAGLVVLRVIAPFDLDALESFVSNVVPQFRELNPARSS